MPLHTYQRTAAHYRSLGYTVWKVEAHDGRGRRRDLGGFLDAIAFKDGEMIGLQACGGSDYAAHRRKICHACARNARVWLRAGAKIHLVGWRQLKDKKWHSRIEEILECHLT